MLFKFITTNLKEINDMVNFDCSDQNIQVKGEKKFRDKTEELKNNSSVLNKIDEVNSYKVSSVSSSRIQKSNKDSHNSSNILKKCNSNSIHIENRKDKKNNLINKSKIPQNVISLNTENFKNLIDDSDVGKEYFTDNNSIIRIQNYNKMKNLSFYNNKNYNIKQNINSYTNFQSNLIDVKKNKSANFTEKTEKSDLDKTKQNELNENKFSRRMKTKNDIKSMLKTPIKIINSVNKNKKELINENVNISERISKDQLKNDNNKKDGKCLIV